MGQRKGQEEYRNRTCQNTMDGAHPSVNPRDPGVRCTEQIHQLDLLPPAIQKKGNRTADNEEEENKEEEGKTQAQNLGTANKLFKPFFFHRPRIQIKNSRMTIPLLDPGQRKRGLRPDLDRPGGELCELLGTGKPEDPGKIPGKGEGIANLKLDPGKLALDLPRDLPDLPFGSLRIEKQDEVFLRAVGFEEGNCPMGHRGDHTKKGKGEGQDDEGKEMGELLCAQKAGQDPQKKAKKFHGIKRGSPL
jgi:hypothetical protein